VIAAYPALAGTNVLGDLRKSRFHNARSVTAATGEIRNKVPAPSEVNALLLGFRWRATCELPGPHSGERILTDTDEVTGSIPVAPTLRPLTRPNTRSGAFVMPVGRRAQCALVTRWRPRFGIVTPSGRCWLPQRAAGSPECCRTWRLAFGRRPQVDDTAVETRVDERSAAARGTAHPARERPHHSPGQACRRAP
jgi:hypothetical protein